MLLVAVAGGVGAVLRYGLDRAVQRGLPGRPLGILLVNVLAGFGIGLLAGLALAGAAAGADAAVVTTPLPAPLGPVLASGLLGGFSTFSTVAVDSAKLWRAKQWGWFAVNTVGMLACSAAACLGGRALGAALL
ncbi:CrcB family protein [Leucobacter sp. CSA1]|uniref:Fluoride-specific ion channel FluC n=1 Tax=Leucobacter chromiisoli TaxID=2796471 RepID=A0A934Q728_9MICO|nr:CrcB family protein [Leucobacter chromiisoli]